MSPEMDFKILNIPKIVFQNTKQPIPNSGFQNAIVHHIDWLFVPFAIPSNIHKFVRWNDWVKNLL